MTSEKTRILILVKTYPVLSNKYAELVCTAGIKEDGFHNIAPNPFLIIGVFYPPRQPEPKESLFAL